MPPIRILIVEPQRLFVRGICQELEEVDEFEIVGQVTTGDDAIAKIRAKQPDIAVSAIIIPDMSGIQILEATKHLPTKILFLTAEESQERIYQAMVQGARGYLLKWGNNIDLGQAIRAVMAGQIVMSPAALTSLIEALRRNTPGSPTSHSILTNREIEVLSSLRQGLRQPEIAKSMDVSITTIKTHCRNIYAKLGVNNQTMAVAEALRRELLE